MSTPDGGKPLMKRQAAKLVSVSGIRQAVRSALEDAAVGEQFTVRIYYDKGEHKVVRRFVNAQEAGRAFRQYTSRVGGAGLDGARVDRNDCIGREWNPGQASPRTT